jgi:hypothetical protein
MSNICVIYIYLGVVTNQGLIVDEKEVGPRLQQHIRLIQLSAPDHSFVVVACWFFEVASF